MIRCYKNSSLPADSVLKQQARRRRIASEGARNWWVYRVWYFPMILWFSRWRHSSPLKANILIAKLMFAYVIVILKGRLWLPSRFFWIWTLFPFWLLTHSSVKIGKRLKTKILSHVNNQSKAPLFQRLRKKTDKGDNITKLSQWPPFPCH